MSVTSDALTRGGAPSDGEGVTPEDGTAEEPTQPSVQPAARSRWQRFLYNRDVWAVLVFIVLAGWVTDRLWRYMGRYEIKDNVPDNIQFEYFLTWATRVVTKFDNPLFLPTLNAPNGVNLMDNTPCYGLTIPLTPVTLMFGPDASFALMTFGALAGTAAAWYWFLSRYVVKSWPAALVGGLFCGFGPGMLSQALAHPNIAAQFLIPLILAQLIRLREGQHTIRRGLVLGLFIFWQAFINEEILFFTAVACFVFFGYWALARRAEAKAVIRPFLAGIGVAGGLAAILLAVPLYYQFFGRMAYHGLWPGARDYGGDLRAIAAFPSVTLAGTAQSVQWAQNPAEQNSFFGWPLLALCVIALVMLWRLTVVRAMAVLAALALVLAPGGLLVVNVKVTHLHGPYALLGRLPLFNSVIPTRWSLVLVPLIGVLLALWLDRMLALVAAAPRERVPVLRLLTYGLVLVALLPLAPRRIHIQGPTPIPQFFASGEWRQYVPADRTVVPVPLASNAVGEDPMRWAIEQDLDFSMPGGYFLVPDPTSANKSSMFGAPARPTSDLFIKVDRTGVVPTIGRQQQANAVADLKYWKAAIVVLPGGRHAEEQQWKLVTRLLGFEPVFKGGVWVWDVRQITG